MIFTLKYPALVNCMTSQWHFVGYAEGFWLSLGASRQWGPVGVTGLSRSSRPGVAAHEKIT